ncbi:DUF551 domain-containing protein [Providencia rustigianii]|uniref:DUF551 domain-containing protein n=1 Tax=Providencia rustigianii TaxID=158850 RepID=UPI000F7134B5|nr:DUF551 domain-containing protein [Providencia rustigianii]VEH55042.1 Protein of uncharacterised function (DUF551) [Providencia rustigianii]
MQGTNWVKVSERLPGECRQVLLKVKNDYELALGFVINGYFYEQVTFSKIANNTVTNTKIPAERVTHWMYLDSIPLPPMPEGE